MALWYTGTQHLKRTCIVLYIAGRVKIFSLTIVVLNLLWSELSNIIVIPECVAVLSSLLLLALVSRLHMVYILHSLMHVLQTLNDDPVPVLELKVTCTCK